MSTPARYLCRAIVVVALALEVAACEVYADDPETVLLNAAIVVYAGIAIAAVVVVDAAVHRFRRR
jgi:hypothetical protein